MKYKVINIIKDGVIAANKNNIVCFCENYLKDDSGEDRLTDIDIGIILNEKNHSSADIYWAYTAKEWNRLNRSFNQIQFENFPKSSKKPLKSGRKSVK